MVVAVLPILQARVGGGAARVCGVYTLLKVLFCLARLQLEIRRASACQGTPGDRGPTNDPRRVPVRRGLGNGIRLLRWTLVRRWVRVHGCWGRARQNRRWGRALLLEQITRSRSLFAIATARDELQIDRKSVV